MKRYKAVIHDLLVLVAWLAIFCAAIFQLGCSSPSEPEGLIGVRVGPNDLEIGPGVGGHTSGGWVRTTIATVVECDGADGVHLGDVDADGDQDIVTACEQGGKILLAKNPGCAAVAAGQPWAKSFLPGATLVGPEDARFGDVDGDGDLDIVTAESAGFKIRSYENLAGVFQNPVTISSGVCRHLHAMVWEPNVVIGGCYSSSAQVQKCVFSGTWSCSKLIDVGFTKGMERFGNDLLVWNHEAPLPGVRRINDISGTPVDAGRLTTSNVSFTQRGTVKGSVVTTGTGEDGVGSSISFLLPSGASVTYPSNFGVYQSAELGDLDGDGDDDLVVTASHAGPPDGEPGLSGVVALLAPTWQRIEVSGSDGAKHDNAELLDVNCDGKPDIITTEERTLGLIEYRNPL